MNGLDNQLNRLFRAAAKSERRAGTALPFGLASRVLAARRIADDETADQSYAVLCRRAVLCSCGVALLFLLLNLQALESFARLNAWHGAEVRLIDSAIQMQIP